MAELHNAALRAPLEIWYRILDMLPQPARLFDPANPIHLHRHFRNEWNRELRRAMAYRSVCRVWRDYLRLGPSESANLELMFRTGVRKMEDRIPRLGMKWFQYVINPSQHILPIAAPNTVFITIDPSSPIQHNQEEFFVELAQIQTLKSLSLMSCPDFEVVGNIARYLPNLVALELLIYNGQAFRPPNNLSFPHLQILDIYPQHVRDKWDCACMSSWSIPSLRHLFIGHSFHRDDHYNFDQFLMNQVGPGLETLGFYQNSGMHRHNTFEKRTDRYTFEMSMWKRFPRLRTILADLNHCHISPPISGFGGFDESSRDGEFFERLIHIGKDLEYMEQYRVMGWIIFATERRGASGTQRRISVEFSRNRWEDIFPLDGSMLRANIEKTERAKERLMAMGRRWRDSGRLLLDKDGKEIAN